MEQFRPGGFKMLPDVVKNLLILNILFYIVTYACYFLYNIDLKNILGLHYYTSDMFRPYQIITHMFMHSGFFHIFFNMFALWMFGSTLENYWGPKRFLTYYFVTGLGAAALHFFIIYLRVSSIEAHMTQEQINIVYSEGTNIVRQGMNYSDIWMSKLNILINVPTIGASGAIFGLLLAFGMIFPDVPLMLMFIPIPIKAKYFVIGYGLLELYSGLKNSDSDNVAHFAHLGGMLFGIFLILYWKKRRIL